MCVCRLHCIDFCLFVCVFSAASVGAAGGGVSLRSSETLAPIPSTSGAAAATGIAAAGAGHMHLQGRQQHQQEHHQSEPGLGEAIRVVTFQTFSEIVSAYSITTAASGNCTGLPYRMFWFMLYPTHEQIVAVLWVYTSLLVHW